MARYIDAAALLENLKKQYGEELGWQCTVNMSDVGMMIEDAPTADVVPKSEVAILTAQNMALEIAKNDLQHRLNTYIGVENILKDNMGELIKAAINGAKQEVAREIFEEIEEALSENFHADCQMGDCIEDYYDECLRDDIAELKKKYTEGGSE